MIHPLPASAADEHPLASSCKGFSNPYERFDESFFETVAMSFAQEALRLFLKNHAALLEQRGRGLTALLEEWLATQTTFDTIWDPAFGAAMSTLTGKGEDEPTDTAVAIALRICAQGRAADFEAQLSARSRLFWGHLLLPPADSLGVESDGRCARLRFRREGTRGEVRLTRAEDGRWLAEGAKELPRFGPPGAGIILLPREAASDADFRELGPSLSEKITGGDIEVCDRALRILEAYAPPYRLWVSRVIRQIILMRPAEEGVMSSGSMCNLPGLIYMSASDKPMPLAEMLVHEASHQYLNLLCRLGPISDGTDTTLYHSPAVRKPRPLDRILVAYHAFANMELLYRLCLDGRIDDEDYCASNQASLRPQLEQLEAPLLDNPALTHIGRALFCPLHARLH